MNFKIVSKENLGCMVLLSLVIILSLAKIFNIVIDTPIGRIIMIMFIIITSYLNKVLGLLSVLFIAIILSNSDSYYYENFTSSPNSSSTSADSSKNTVSTDLSKSIGIIDPSNNISNITTSTNNLLKKTQQTVSNSSNSSNTSIASNTTEGFDIIGIENEIKKGKQSNSIPVSTFMRQSEYISPHQFSSFGENFSNF